MVSKKIMKTKSCNSSNATKRRRGKETKLAEAIRITEIVWDNGGWNIPLPPATVYVPKKDVLFSGETVDDLKKEEFRARVNDYLSQRYGADVVGWRYRELFVSNDDY